MEQRDDNVDEEQVRPVEFVATELRPSSVGMPPFDALPSGPPGATRKEMVVFRVQNDA